MNKIEIFERVNNNAFCCNCIKVETTCINICTEDATITRNTRSRKLVSPKTTFEISEELK